MPTSPQQQRPTPSRECETRSLALSAVGILMVVSVAIGAGVGMLLDERLGTGPWLTAVGVVLGATAGFHEMWRLVRASDAVERPRGARADDDDLKNL